MENHSNLTGWQKLFFPDNTNASNSASATVAIAIFELPNFNMLFQLILTKFYKKDLFSCLPKVDHVITVMQVLLKRSVLLIQALSTRVRVFLKTKVCFFVFEKIRVHTLMWRIRFVFACPHKNALTIGLTGHALVICDIIVFENLRFHAFARKR